MQFWKLVACNQSLFWFSMYCIVCFVSFRDLEKAISVHKITT